MTRFHIAISTDKIDETVSDYSKRLGTKPSLVVSGEYALWRTEFLNVSVRRDSGTKSGTVRHLGWEDPVATEFESDTDVNGILWERFNASQQADEINQIWPNANYRP